MAEKGWIKTYRKIQECWIWLDKEPFDKRSAWIDLLLTANHADKKILFNGELITVQRGQILTSVRKLSLKWKWSVNKVYRFLELLINDEMIKKESDNSRTLLTIVNYEVYQGIEYTNEYTNEHSVEHSVGNSTETPSNTPSEHKQECKELKNDKNVKNERKNILVSKDTNCQTQDVGRAVEEWNTLSEFGIKPISKLSSDSKRYQNLNARIKQYGIDDVLKAIDNIRHSNFLQGKHTGKPWQITFDWFVLPNNFPKVLEGNYENVETAFKQTTGNTYIDAIQNRVSEVDNW